VRKFTNDWFQQTAETNFVNNLLPRKAQFKKAMEIGCYEGQATCWMLDHMAFDQIHCVDTWLGGAEHKAVDMKAVCERFFQNVADDQKGIVEIDHCTSTVALSGIMAESKRRLLPGQKAGYDFIYVDGSHLAKDVLTDAVLAWQILEPGGYLAFDDYTWTEKPRQEANPLDNPRLAIDAFYTIFRREAVILPSTQHQFWLMKV
jgi:predicted O-methyltransferase YrrM